MEKENTQSQELQKLVEAWSAMQKYAFYVGTSRGVLSCLNTLCLRFGGMSFEDYTKAAFKPQLNQMLTLSQAMQLLGSLLKSLDDLINYAMMEAKNELEQEKQGEKNDNSLVTPKD